MNTLPSRWQDLVEVNFRENPKNLDSLVKLGSRNRFPEWKWLEEKFFFWHIHTRGRRNNSLFSHSCDKDHSKEWCLRCFVNPCHEYFNMKHLKDIFASLSLPVSAAHWKSNKFLYQKWYFVDTL